MNFMVWNDISPDRFMKSNLNDYIEYTDMHIARNQRNVTQMILGNPDVIEVVVQSSMMIIPPDVKKEFEALGGPDV